MNKKKRIDDGDFSFSAFIFFSTLLVLLFVLALFLPSDATAQETKPDIDRGKVKQIEKSEPAPFEGIIFSPVGFANFVAQKEAKYEKKINKLKKEKEVQKIKYELKLKNKNKVIKIQDKQIKNIRNSKSQYIKKLEEKASGNSSKIIYFVAGTISGGLIVYGSVRLGRSLAE